MGEVYLPVLVLGILGLAFGAFGRLRAFLIGPHRYNRAKLDAYECGIEPTPQPMGGGQFPIKYYLTAMLFIVFDIEIVFLYPFAVAFDQLGALRPRRDGAVHRHRRSWPTPTCGAAAGWNGTDRTPPPRDPRRRRTGG